MMSAVRYIKSVHRQLPDIRMLSRKSWTTHNWASLCGQQMRSNHLTSRHFTATSSQMVENAVLDSGRKKQMLVKDRGEATKIRRGDPPEPEVDVDDIQGDALCGFNKPHLAILALNIKDDSPSTIGNVKKWLSEYVIPSVTSARDVLEFRQIFRMMRERRGNRKPTSLAQTCLQISFSYGALNKLAPSEDVERFQKAGTNDGFQYGLPARSTKLHDPKTGEGAKENWEVGAGENPHILMQIASDQTDLIQQTIDILETGLSSFNDPAKITHRQFGKRREDFPGHEHFGFLDGISNFGVRGTYETLGDSEYITPRYLHRKDDRSHLYGLPGQVLLWPGELILGLPKQYLDTNSEEPEQSGSCDFTGPEWARNGSFLVYRRLKQDVAKFWNFMHANVDDICPEKSVVRHNRAEDIAAKVIGRWRSGAPIMRSPTGDSPDLGKDPLANNAFLYNTDLNEDPFQLKPGHSDEFPQSSADNKGLVCPMSGHLRKVQPRDSSTDFGNSYDTLQHMVMRRGIQYGDVILNERIDDGKDRGLMFVCYQRSIDKQFEFLITKWANSPTVPFDSGHDMVIGQSSADDRARTFDIPLPDGTIKKLETTEEWVIPTGGGYFFMPSISALKNVIAKIE